MSLSKQIRGELAWTADNVINVIKFSKIHKHLKPCCCNNEKETFLWNAEKIEELVNRKYSMLNLLYCLSYKKYTHTHTHSLTHQTHTRLFRLNMVTKASGTVKICKKSYTDSVLIIRLKEGGMERGSMPVMKFIKVVLFFFLNFKTIVRHTRALCWVLLLKENGNERKKKENKWNAIRSLLREKEKQTKKNSNSQ